MSEINVLDQIGEVEELNIAQRLMKEFLDHEKLPDEEIEKLRKKNKIPESVEMFGVDLSTLRQFSRMLSKVYKAYDFPRFFKLIEILWMPEASLEEHYLALLLIQNRKKDLAEVDVCLDLWNFLWGDFKENVHDWTLTELIATTIGYQIIETWQSIEDEETNQIIWDSLKEKAADERNGSFGKIFAVMCPVRRIRKLGKDAVLPSLEVVLSAIAKFEAEEREIGKAMERAIMLTLRECAKTNPKILLQFINRFYKFFPIKVIKDMSRYYKEETEKKEYQSIFKKAKEYLTEEEDEEDDEENEDEEEIQ
ncbi:MAG: DNA alkylation repair protein [Candidatus Hodarchaeales archaeon]|jgi:hypothetical protein